MIPTKRQIQTPSGPRWQLDYGLDVNGKRVRVSYEIEGDADDKIDEAKRFEKKMGDWWLKLSDLERTQTFSIVTQIKSAGLSLQRVWDEHRKWAEEARKKQRRTSATYKQAVAEWKRRKLAGGKEEKYVNEVEGTLNAFGKGREEFDISDILPEDVDMWIDSHIKEPHCWSDSTRRTIRGRFSSLWSVAVDKGWCEVNIIDRLEPITVNGPAIRIYPNPTILNIFCGIMSNKETQKILGSITMQSYGCLRPDEAESKKAIRNGHKPFGWHDIDLEHGRATVRPEVAKEGDQRTVRMQPNCVAWMKLAKKLVCPFPSVNERRLIDQVCQMIGLDGPEDWIRDGLRKTNCTHLRNLYKNDFDVVEDHGNSIRVLLDHYAKLQTPPEVSQDYFKIDPEMVEARLKSAEWKEFLRQVAKDRDARSKTQHTSASDTK